MPRSDSLVGLARRGVIPQNKFTPKCFYDPVVLVKRLIACRNQLYRETGTYPDDLGAALQRTEFLLHDILAGLITPAAAKTETAQAPVPRKPVSIQ